MNPETRVILAHADLCFIRDTLDWKSKKPYRIVGPLPVEQEPVRTNIETEVHKNVPIHDARPQKLEFSLDKEGFEFVSYEPKVQISSDEDVTRYLEDIAAFLKVHFNTPHVFAYDLRIRSAQVAEVERTDIRNQAIDVVNLIHADLSRIGAHKRFSLHLQPDEHAELVNSKWKARVINTWIPIENPAFDYPLLLADRRTVEEEDLVPTDQVMPDFVGEFLHPKFSPSQVWYSLSEQQTHEMALFSTYDGSIPGNSGACVHGTFHNTLAPSDAPKRKSVETRSLVFMPWK